MVGKRNKRPLPRRQLCRDENGFEDRDQQRRDLLEIQERPQRQLRSHLGRGRRISNCASVSFGMISERLKSDDISLTKNQHNNTCRIHSDKYEIHLGNFGLLLGFKKDTVITRGTKTDSGEVDVNSGFRLVTIGCDIVNPTKISTPAESEAKPSLRSRLRPSNRSSTTSRFTKTSTLKHRSSTESTTVWFFSSIQTSRRTSR